MDVTYFGQERRHLVFCKRHSGLVSAGAQTKLLVALLCLVCLRPKVTLSEIVFYEITYV